MPSKFIIPSFSKITSSTANQSGITEWFLKKLKDKNNSIKKRSIDLKATIVENTTDPSISTVDSTENADDESKMLTEKKENISLKATLLDNGIIYF